MRQRGDLEKGPQVTPQAHPLCPTLKLRVWIAQMIFKNQWEKKNQLTDNIKD